MRIVQIWIVSLMFGVFAASLVVAQSAETRTAPFYPNSERGLELLMADMLALQKSGDAAALAPYLQSLILPNSEAWFTSTFGDERCGEQQLAANDCLGPRMAFTYRPLAKVLPASFSLTLADFCMKGLPISKHQITTRNARDLSAWCPLGSLSAD